MNTRHAHEWKCVEVGTDMTCACGAWLTEELANRYEGVLAAARDMNAVLWDPNRGNDFRSVSVARRQLNVALELYDRADREAKPFG